MTEFKYKENEILFEIEEYIESTYSQHYKSKKTDMQAVDVWEALGTLEMTARDNSLKYLLRYGKKDGKNKKDLLKAMHYIILMMYTLEEESKNASTS
jgi:hypothetical protein